MMLKESAIIAVIIVAAIPLIGFLENVLIMGILRNVFGIISRSGGLFLFFVNRVTFVGVMYHELSHALFAFLTGAKVDKISLYHKEGDHLGYVQYRARGIWPLQCVQHSLSSCAPVVMGLLALAGIYSVLTKITLPVWGLALLIYVFVSILVHMDMSTQDLKLYLKGVPFFLILSFVIVLICLSINPDGFYELIPALPVTTGKSLIP
jgi:hypothetical protein